MDLEELTEKESTNEKFTHFNTNKYLDIIGQIKLLTKEEERELIKKAQDGDLKARNQVVLSNLRLVVKIAKRYLNYGLSLDDLVSEGNYILFHVIDKFDLSKDYKFSTYATYWLQQVMQKKICDSIHVSRLSYRKDREINILEKKKNEFYNKNNRKPNLEELAKEMEMSVEKLKELILLAKKSVSLSLDMALTDNEDFTLEKIYQQDESRALEDIVIDKLTKKDLQKLIDSIKWKEKELIFIDLRYYKNYTLDKIGQVLGCTRQNASLMESQIIYKFRTYKKIKNWAHLMDNPEKAMQNIDIFLDLYELDAHNKYKLLLNRVK